jgi:hypothetical protein
MKLPKILQEIREPNKKVGKRMSKKLNRVKITHKGVLEGKEPVPAEIIAESIVKIADGVQSIKASRLNDRALIVLLKDETGLSARDIKTVIKALEDLKRLYLKDDET